MKLSIAILEFVFLIVPWIASIGWLCARVLGIRLGPWRAAIVAIVGWLAGLVVTGIVHNDDPGITAGVLTTMFFGLMVAMPLAVTLDLLTRRANETPAHRRRLRKVITHPIRSSRDALAPWGRMREVVRDARHHNLVHVRYRTEEALDSPDFARRIREVLEESGGMMVKFGQIASTRTDLLPEALTTELSHLRSDVRPIPPDDVRGALEAGLGEPVANVFADFEWEPLAAASIGQTHRARLVTGESVVVKVQRPGVGDLVARDAAVLRLVARQLDRRVDAAHRVGITRLADELVDGIEAELDYTKEAAAGRRFAETLAGDNVRVARVYPTLCTPTVLVMDEIPGTSVDDEAAVAACGVARSELAERLLRSFLHQILHDGLYHADPHPGNVFIDGDGHLWLLDFGAVGRLSPTTLEGLQGIAMGLGLQDVSLIARGVRHLAGGAATVDLRALEADLGTVMANLGTGFDPTLIREILATMDRHGLAIPSAMSLLSRSLITLEGTLGVICPGFDFAGTGEALARADAASTLTDPQDLLQHELVRALPSLRTLPEHAEAISAQLRDGSLTLRTERYAGADRVVVERWLDRGTIAFIGGSGAVASALLLVGAGVTRNEGIRETLWVLGFGGMTFGATLMLRSAAQSLRRLPVRDG